MLHPFLAAIERRVLLADGATGTLLHERGVAASVCLDALNLDDPALVRRVHEDYLAAGADIIQTNTFGANRVKLARYGLQEQVREINLRAVKIARDAREISGNPAFVAGSMGPLGLAVEPLGRIGLEEARYAFREQVEALLEGGADLILLETFPSIRELAEAVRAAREACDLPVVAQVTFQEDGRTPAGESPAEVANALRAAGADVVGVNCGVGPQAALRIIAEMASASDARISASPNAGQPMLRAGRLHYPATPDYFADFARKAVEAGASVVGGCCGTTPEHTGAMRAALEGRPGEAAPAVTVMPASESVPLAERAAGVTPEPGTLREKLAAGRFVVSVEIDPPRGVNPRKALEGAELCQQAGADAVNVADSPMARVRMSAIAMAALVQQQVGIETIVHCTTRDRNLMALQSDLIGAHALGIRNVIALTGDPPSLGDYAQATGVWDVDSIGFITIIKRLNEGTDWAGNSIGRPTDFLVACAANPAADDVELEARRVRRKIEAGADVIMTQFVWDPDLVDRFFDLVGPVSLPIILGVLPLQSYRHAEYMHNEVPGVTIPAEIRERMRRAGENGGREGLAIAKDFVEAMRDRVQGIYCMPSFGRYETVAELIAVARHAGISGRT